MSLRAVIDGRSVQSWDIGEEDWLALKCRSRTGGLGLAMPCCQTRAVPKTAASRLRFFSHHGRQGIDGCSGGHESERHLRLKALAADAARRAGWTVRTEVRGACPYGEELQGGEAPVSGWLCAGCLAKAAAPHRVLPVLPVLWRSPAAAARGTRSIWGVARFHSPGVAGSRASRRHCSDGSRTQTPGQNARWLGA
jgi:hypothetical protein